MSERWSRDCGLRLFRTTDRGGAPSSHVYATTRHGASIWPTSDVTPPAIFRVGLIRARLRHSGANMHNRAFIPSHGEWAFPSPPVAEIQERPGGWKVSQNEKQKKEHQRQILALRWDMEAIVVDETYPREYLHRELRGDFDEQSTTSKHARGTHRNATARLAFGGENGLRVHVVRHNGGQSRLQGGTK